MYFHILKNVDISCCGVFLEIRDKEIRLRESCKNGIIHGLTKTFEINNWSKFYDSGRTAARERKLSSKGWKNLDNISMPFIYVDEVPNIKIERLLKITSLEFKPEYDYKIWTLDEYKINKKKKNDEDYDLPF